MPKEPKQIVELITLIKRLRTLAWIGLADGRTSEEKDKALREIQILTAWVGNDPPEENVR